MHKKRYYIAGYVKCGEMPLYLLFYYDRRGYSEHSVLLCTHKQLKLLLRQTKGFETPKDYGKVIYKGRENAPYPTMGTILKARYGFDLNNAEIVL